MAQTKMNSPSICLDIYITVSTVNYSKTEFTQLHRHWRQIRSISVV